MSDEAIEAITGAIKNGKLPSLNELSLRMEDYNNPRLRAACEEHGVELV